MATAAWSESYKLSFDPQQRQSHGAQPDFPGDHDECGGSDRGIFDRRENQKLGLRVLEDDLNYFPVYQAVWVARQVFVESSGPTSGWPCQTQGRISEQAMLDMNAQADIQKMSFERIAAHFLGVDAPQAERMQNRILRRTARASVAGRRVAAVFHPHRHSARGDRGSLSRGRSGHFAASALVQTIPSLALLCFLIPLFGVGTRPALAALCLYSLLPVVLNTYTGIRAVDPRHLENARAFGMNSRQVLFRVVLPLASPMLLAGIKTATIVSIGTATLAALVGAGGYGAPIVSGLALNDVPTILYGGHSRRLMALVAHGLFELLGVTLIPAGLRRRS